MVKKFISILIFLFWFSSAIAQLQHKARTAYRAGIELFNNNKFTEALNEYNRAIGFDGKFDSVYLQLGILYLKIGNSDEGMKNLQKAIKLNPRLALGYTSIARIYRDFTRIYDSAIYFYKLALPLDTKDVENCYGLAWIYNATGVYDSAIVYGIKALNIDNNYKPAYGELAFAYRKSERFRDAVEQFKKNLSVSIIDLAYLYSGYCYTQLNEKENALECYEKLNAVNEKMATALKRQIDLMK